MYELIDQAADRNAECIQEQIVNVRSSFKEGKLEDLYNEISAPAPITFRKEFSFL